MHYHVSLVAFPLNPKINQDLWFFHPELKTHVRVSIHWHEAHALTSAVVSSNIPPSIQMLIVSSRHCCSIISKLPIIVNVSSKSVLIIAAFISSAISRPFSFFVEMRHNRHSICPANLSKRNVSQAKLASVELLLPHSLPKLHLFYYLHEVDPLLLIINSLFFISFLDFSRFNLILSIMEAIRC